MKRLWIIIGVALLGLTPVQVDAVEHSEWATVLERHVESGFFDYESFMDNRDSRDRLSQYLDRLSSVNPEELERDEQLAVWINLYNAATLRLIEKHYPVESIRDLDGWISTAFQKEFIDVRGQTRTLDYVEHEIIRPNFDEPRIHFALVCAARSCPPLRHEPYTGERLDQQLREQTEVFLNSDKNQWSVQSGTLMMNLSSIFSWFADDFGGESGVVEFVGERLSEDRKKLVEQGEYQVRYLDYDWSLNQAPGPYESINP